jgi:hypothetical protein
VLVDGDKLIEGVTVTLLDKELLLEIEGVIDIVALEVELTLEDEVIEDGIGDELMDDETLAEGDKLIEELVEIDGVFDCEVEDEVDIVGVTLADNDIEDDDEIEEEEDIDTEEEREEDAEVDVVVEIEDERLRESELVGVEDVLTNELLLQLHFVTILVPNDKAPFKANKPPVIELLVISVIL